VDLLNEFKQFLPDTSGNQTPASSALFGMSRILPHVEPYKQNLSLSSQGLGDQGSPPIMNAVAVKKKRTPAYTEKVAPTSLTKVREKKRVMV
jgi:histone deacetylase complex regulatory component SIN3